MTAIPRPLETRGGGSRISMPVVVLIVVLTWAVSAGITYGVLSTRLDWLVQRVENIEKNQSEYIQRPEYDTAARDLTNRLDRIERKIDALK
jgi:hypothetical protein